MNINLKRVITKNVNFMHFKIGTNGQSKNITLRYGCIESCCQ